MKMHTIVASFGLLALTSTPLAAHPGHHGETLGVAAGWIHYVTQPDHGAVVLLGLAGVVLAVALVDALRTRLPR